MNNLLLTRSGNKCELCQSGDNLSIYEVQPQSSYTDDNCIITCDTCSKQINREEESDMKHWNCLSASMWSEVTAVQVVSWRMLNRFKNESWAAGNLDMMYLDDELLTWAKAIDDSDNTVAGDIHKDSNGSILQAGDTIVLTKSLDVKGSQLNARMGTVIKNIKLVENNTDLIEGKIEGQVIVIRTKYVRKQGA
jgi:protein PhnA